jgi:hypothetical protein
MLIETYVGCLDAGRGGEREALAEAHTLAPEAWGVERRMGARKPPRMRPRLLITKPFSSFSPIRR